MELGAGMPLARPEQVGDLGVRAPGHELADRVAAVQEPAPGAVDQGDRALGADDPGQPRRVRPGVGWSGLGWEAPERSWSAARSGGAVGRFGHGAMVPRAGEEALDRGDECARIGVMGSVALAGQDDDPAVRQDADRAPRSRP